MCNITFEQVKELDEDIEGVKIDCWENPCLCVHCLIFIL